MINGQVVEMADGGDGLALFALAVSALTLFWTVGLEVYKRRRDHLDEFWFRTVVAPSCIEPLVAFCNKWTDLLDAPMSLTAGRGLASKFGTEKAGIISKLWISKLMFSDLYEQSGGLLDDVEDLMAKEMGRVYTLKGSSVDFSEARDELQTAGLKILGEFAKRHGGRLNVG